MVISIATRNLNLKHNKSGELRLYSRLKNMNILFAMKTPVFIDTNHKLAELIRNYCHSKVLHTGILTNPQRMMSCVLDYTRYFIKMLLHSCAICIRLNARAYEYPNHSNIPELCFNERYHFSST